MGKTLQVAADRAYDQSKTVLPAEVARGVYMRNAPSLRALKLMHLMISTAGGRMAQDVRHEMRLSDIRRIEGMAHHDRESLKPLFEELRAAVLTYDDPQAMRYTIGGLLDQAVVDYRHELSGDVLVSWFFGRMFRDMAERSNHWAILDRQTVFHLGSKYSVLLFQHVASLVNLNHIASKTFSVGELRAVLGVQDGKLDRFSNLNQRVLQPAIAEINQTSRLMLTAPPPSPAAAPAQRLLVEAGIDLLPDWARRMHGFSGPGLATPVVRAGAGGMSMVLRWALKAPLST